MRKKKRPRYNRAASARQPNIYCCLLPIHQNHVAKLKGFNRVLWSAILSNAMPAQAYVSKYLGLVGLNLTLSLVSANLALHDVLLL